jgi:hypothetical protein
VFTADLTRLFWSLSDISFLVFRFPVGGKLDDQDGYSGKQQKMNQPVLMEHKTEDEPRYYQT